MEQNIYPNIRKTSTFSMIQEKHKVTVVKAYANWCKPCKKISPLIDKLVERQTNDFAFVPINDRNVLFHYLEINKLPTLICFVGFEKKMVLESSKEEDVREFFRKVESFYLAAPF